MWLLKPTHKHIGRNTLSEYLDGRLQGRDLERVEQQLGECHPCRLELEELQATVAMMRQLPMETPRRSFVMSAPPLEPARAEPARARPALALRAPSWVYAGAASVAALALAVTVSVDATGGLSSDPLRRDVAVTAPVPAPASEQLAATAAATADAKELAGGAAAQEEPAVSTGGGAPAPEFPAPPVAITEPAPLGTPSSVAALAPTAPDTGATIVESGVAEPPSTTVVPNDGQAVGARSTIGAEDTSTVETETAKALPVEEPTPVSETAEPAVIEPDGDSDTPIWWRVLEAAAGVLAVGFLAGLLLRWRANRRDLA